MRIFPFTLMATLCVAAPVIGQAHELWIDPEQYQIAPFDEVIADIRVGQDFVGGSQVYLPRDFSRMEIVLGDQVQAVDGRVGDRPAINTGTMGEGLNIITYETNVLTVFYSDWEKWMAFVNHKAFEDVETRHDARALPREKFREAYTRHAKSLVAVGAGEGQDREIGLATEIVALANPYTDEVSSGGLPVKVLYQGEIRVNAQVEIFEEAPAQGDAKPVVNVTTTRTNEQGIALIPVKPDHEYMIDAVVLREPSDALAQEKNVVWETLWANLTFKMPAP